MIHHRLRSLRMSALAARASTVCLSWSLILGVFSGAGLANPLLNPEDDFSGEAASQATNAQPKPAPSAQTTSTQSATQQQATPPQTQPQQQKPPQNPPQTRP